MSFIEFADEPTQEERIAKLRAELEKLGGSATKLDSMPADMEELVRDLRQQNPGR